MLINKDHIFMHIPKTAGRSIMQMYSEKTGINRGILIMTNYITGEKIHNPHMTASEVMCEIGTKAYSEAFKFSVVRNPLDRMVSFYHYGLNRLQKNVFTSFEQFVDFIYYDKKMGDMGWNNAKISQSDYLDQNIDYIAKFETIDKDWGFLSKKLGINAPLTKVNASRHKPFMTYYNKETERKIREIFNKDFVRFKY